jgi:hypothetical protein
MVISRRPRFLPYGSSRSAGMSEIRSGFANTLKHSARSFFEVMVGSNKIAPWFCLAMAFLAFRLAVSDRLPWWPFGRSGFSLGLMLRILVRASCAQACGFWHPLSLSLVQSAHSHSGSCSCGASSLLCLMRADIMIRSATLATRCRWRRHLDGAFVRGRVLDDM